MSTKTNFIHVDGPCRCVRCNFTTEQWHNTGLSFIEQHQVLEDHLDADHPNWRTEQLSYPEANVLCQRGHYPPMQCLCAYYLNGKVARDPACPVHQALAEPIEFACIHDHCAPEERAAIETAVRFRETMKVDMHPLAGQDHYTAFHEHCAAVDALLTARKEQR